MARARKECNELREDHEDQLESDVEASSSRPLGRAEPAGVVDAVVATPHRVQPRSPVKLLAMQQPGIVPTILVSTTRRLTWQGFQSC